MKPVTNDTAAIIASLSDEFAKTKLLWLLWYAAEPKKVLPNPTLALWVDSDSDGNLSGFVQSYDRAAPQFQPPLYALTFSLDDAARIGFHLPHWQHPDVDHISDVLLQDMWKHLLASQELVEILIRRHQDKFPDAAATKADMFFCASAMIRAEFHSSASRTTAKKGAVA